MNKSKLKAFAALSYIPFGIALLPFQINILIKVVILLTAIPSVIVGLKSSRKNDVWEHFLYILDCCLLPFTRIEFAVIGILSTLTLDTTTWYLVLYVSLPLTLLACSALAMWLFAAIGATYEEEYRTSLFLE